MKRITVIVTSLLVAALMLCSVLVACTAPAGADPGTTDTQAPSSQQPTAEPTAEPTTEPTPEPTIPPNVLYGGTKQLSSDDLPSPGHTILMGNFRDEYLEQAEKDGSVFAVRIMINTDDGISEQLQNWRKSSFGESGDPFTAKDQAYANWLYERFSDPEENMKFNAFQNGYEYAEEALKDVLFEDYWRKNAPEEAAAYDEALEAWLNLREELLGDAVHEELARLRSLGLDLRYEHGAYMTGYLTADQIRNFPAGTEHGFYIYWQLDPELTPEKVEEMLNSDW